MPSFVERSPCVAATSRRTRARARSVSFILCATLATTSAVAAPPSLERRLFSPRLPPLAASRATSVRRYANFLSDDEIEAIHAAADSVRGLTGEVSRSNGLEEGSWRTVFFNHRLATLLPDLHARLVAAARDADESSGWGVLDAQRVQLAMRCAEYHVVTTAGGLPNEKHYDAGSLITMDLMLSEADAFEGGVFQTLEPDGTMRRHAFGRGDLLVFLAHKYHCVTPVTRGTRNVFVCELWEGLERRCPRRCDVPFGPCACRLTMQNLLVRMDDEGRTDLAKVPFSRSTPLPIKQGWAAMRKLRGR